MSEAAPPAGGNAAAQDASAAEAGPLNLTPAQLEQLTELVYGLLKQETLVGRERRGEFMQSRWR